MMEMRKVSVSEETARLLSRGSLVDPVTGECHKSHQKPLGRKLRMVRGKYVRVHFSVASLKETAYAVGFLKDYPDGVVKGTLDRTARWRLGKLVEGGYAEKVEGGCLIDPGKWSVRGYDEELLPKRFR